MENKEKDYEILILTKYKNFVFINTNKTIDSLSALGILAKASNAIASSTSSRIDPKYSIFPVFVTVDENKAKKIVSMTNDEWDEYTDFIDNQ